MTRDSGWDTTFSPPHNTIHPGSAGEASSGRTPDLQIPLVVGPLESGCLGAILVRLSDPLKSILTANDYAHVRERLPLEGTYL